MAIEFTANAEARIPLSAMREIEHSRANATSVDPPICCSIMRPYATGTACPDHGDNWQDCPDYTVVKIGDRYGLPARTGEHGSASSYNQIRYCPWCGADLLGKPVA